MNKGYYRKSQIEINRIHIFSNYIKNELFKDVLSIYLIYKHDPFGR